MKTTSRIITALTVTVALAMPTAPALADHCGGDHAAAKHAKASASAPAIYDLASESGFNTLTTAIDAAGLSDTLNQDGPFTVFAPTDEAFAKLPESTLRSLLSNKQALKQVLLYHVASGKVYAEDVVKLDAAETLNGQEVKISTGDGVKVNDARVVKTDIKASNGVIHVIDTVLIPSDLNL